MSESTLRQSSTVEMAELNDSNKAAEGAPSQLNDVSIPSTSPITADFVNITTSTPAGNENATTAEQSHAAEPVANASSKQNPSTAESSEERSTLAPPADATAPSSPTPPTVFTRVDSVAIGPSTETPTKPHHFHHHIHPDAGPTLVITLLLTSGARHPYKIDEKYLAKRNVNVPGVTKNGKKDPFSISVYTLKELILREWREEWEQPPSSPSSIRLIFFGRLLDDKTPLKDCRFATDAANVVHMTVRPQDIVDEEDAAKGKGLLSRDRDGGERTAGCRCVIL